MFYGDWVAVKANLTKVKQLCEEGGDWERKNKVKVRPAAHLPGVALCTELAQEWFHVLISLLSDLILPNCETLGLGIGDEREGEKRGGALV